MSKLHRWNYVLLDHLLFWGLLLENASALISSLHFDVPDLHYLQVMNEKKDLVEENEIVTQLYNRSSNSMKADVFYYVRKKKCISESGGLLQAAFFAIFLITLLELSIWNCPKRIFFFLCILHVYLYHLLWLQIGGIFISTQ